MNKENLTKVIAENSNYSRRKAEELIRLGLVSINNHIAQLGEKVSKNDEIKVNGQKIVHSQKVYIKLNKPVAYVCTNRSFKGEKNIFSLIIVTLSFGVIIITISFCGSITNGK